MQDEELLELEKNRLAVMRANANLQNGMMAIEHASAQAHRLEIAAHYRSIVTAHMAVTASNDRIAVATLAAALLVRMPNTNEIAAVEYARTALGVSDGR